MPAAPGDENVFVFQIQFHALAFCAEMRYSTEMPGNDHGAVAVQVTPDFIAVLLWRSGAGSMPITRSFSAHGGVVEHGVQLGVEACDHGGGVWRCQQADHVIHHKVWHAAFHKGGHIEQGAGALRTGHPPAP